MPASTPSIPMQLGHKTSPAPFLSSGWKVNKGLASWSWNLESQAILHLDLPPVGACYFMAEVSALSPNQLEHPQTIMIHVNDTFVGEWTIDSTTIHDKLVIIPTSTLQPGTPATIFFSLQPPSQPVSANTGMKLHTITVDTDIKAYLAELQTGYNWVCGIRDELLDTIRRVLYFFRSIDNAPPQLTAPLQAILHSPYVEARHVTKVVFDELYFKKNLPQLKEGHVHQAIRQWMADLQHLQEVVVNAGNYATRQPGIRCWDQDSLNQLSPPPLEFSDKIAELHAKNNTLNNLEILLQKDAIDSVPPILYLDITNRCNFRCRMCYQSTSHFLRQNLINEHMAVILDMAPYLTEITIAGLGEPLLSKNLLSLAERAQMLHCHTSLITNGSLIPANLPTLKRFSSVSISFDGAEAKTFETLRNRSNFQQIVNNITRLRAEAPDTTIAFSVVLSRANIDELSGIVQLAADLGVNIVNVTPLEHMPLFELKRSDFALFQAQLTEATGIADQIGITLSVAIGPQNFSDTEDTPWDKKAIIDTLAAQNPVAEHDARPEAIGLDLLSSPFNYYPAPIVFMLPAWPEITENCRPEENTKKTSRQEFNIDRELCRLDQKIEDCLNELRQRPDQSLTIPYCLDPWKLNYVKSNGTSRLCCHTDHIVGDLGSYGFRTAINSPEYLKIRQAMTGHQPLLPACKKCRAADRALGLESINDTCRKFDLPVPAGLKL